LKKTSGSKPSKVVYLDFDDFGERNHRLDWLFQLRSVFPNFKVNLFTIPSECSVEFLNYVATIDWVQLCVHGFYHKHNEDVDEKFLENRSQLHQHKHFAPIYRAPYWQLSDEMYERLTKLGYKIMLHPDDSRWVSNTTGTPKILLHF